VKTLISIVEPGVFYFYPDLIKVIDLELVQLVQYWHESQPIYRGQTSILHPLGKT
jgi:hypothetical protein